MGQTGTITTRLPESPGIFERLGPVFTKELILASRRPWNYLLRTLYVAAMVGVIFYYWRYFSIMGGGRLDQIAAMSAFGLYLTITVCVFQFFALQVVAPVLTGSVIGEEIRKQTLATLLLTPISSFQIVMGKLLSRTLVMLLLVATSFPFLALIRIFGGVEWRTLVALETLTLNAAIFSATLSLTFSILFSKRTRDPAMLTYIILVLAYLIIPLILGSFTNFRSQPEDYFGWFNPFFSMTLVIRDATLPGRSAGFPGLSAPAIQCALQLFGTAALIAISTVLVRRQALRQALGVLTMTPDTSTTESNSQTSTDDEQFRHTPESRILDRVSDYPVIWREWKRSFSISPWKRNFSILLCFALMFGSYAYFWSSLQEADSHIVYVEIFFVFILARAASAPGYAVTREKEANTLEALRMTPLTPEEIIYGKTLGLLPALVPLVLLLTAHLLFFTIFGPLQLTHIFEILIVLAGPLFFIICTGIFFAIRAKKVVNAVSHNQILGVLLWAPCCPWTSIFFQYGLSLSVNPFLIAIACFEPGSPRRVFGIPGSGAFADYAFCFLVLISLLYTAVGYFFLRRAVAGFYRFSAEQNKNG